MDDFDDLLPRLDALNHLDADRFRLHAIDEIARHLEIDVRLQQRHAHFAQGFTDIFLGYLSEPAQVPERVLELAA